MPDFLGSTDDGHGRWVAGFFANGGHPNDLGSTEMYYSIVPSLFSAIEVRAVPRLLESCPYRGIKRRRKRKLIRNRPVGIIWYKSCCHTS